MKSINGEAKDGTEGTFEYEKPVLIRLDGKDGFQLGMCGVGVTGSTLCNSGSGAGACTVGGGGSTD